MRIERGIDEIVWKTKDGTQVKYRVRIKRKDFAADKVFNSLKEARDFVSLAQSKDGQKALTEHGERAKLVEEAMIAYLKSPPLEVYLQQFYLRYLCHEQTPTKKRSSMAAKSRIKTICQTELKTNPRPITGLVVLLKKYAKGNEIKTLGSLKPEDITRVIATDYIYSRIQAKAKEATIRGEIALLSSFFNKLQIMDEKLYERLKENPFEKCDKSEIKSKQLKRKRRLKQDEEERLFAELLKFKNPEMLEIVVIALSTGMRRGEILELKWSNLGEHTIVVEDAKSGPREVVLDQDAKNTLMIAKERKSDDQIFHYTADGFASNWDRIKKRAKVENFRFHDCRRTFLGEILDKISNPVVISESTTMRDANHIQRAYIEPLQAEKSAANGILTEIQLRDTMGHSSRRMTSHYYSRRG